MNTIYNEPIVMPLNYVLVDENEMTYTNGGAYYSRYMDLAAAKNLLGKVVALNILGTGVSAVGTVCFAGFAITDLYFGYNAWRALDCYNDVCKWEGMYGSNRACRVGANIAADKIVTGVDVELLDYYINAGGHGGGGGHR